MRTVKIYANDIGRYNDVSPFLVEEGVLELKIELPRVSGEFFIVAELNGKNTVKKISNSGMVTLEISETGELSTEVKHYIRGELIEVFKIEPLLLKAVDKELSAMPEIAILKEEISNIKKELSDFSIEAKNEIKELKESSFKTVAAFLSFAYAEYQNDLQLNAKSLSFEEFLCKLGYSVESFSIEQIEKIKNFKEIV